MEKRSMIFVVDDSSANLQLCKGILGDDYDLRLMKSGKAVIDALGRLYPDIILLDIEMPDMSGFEVMAAINDNPVHRTIPVIFVTSHATVELVAKAREQGAADYVVKPFDAEVLRAKIKNALAARG